MAFLFPCKMTVEISILICLRVALCTILQRCSHPSWNQLWSSTDNCFMRYQSIFRLTLHPKMGIRNKCSRSWQAMGRNPCKHLTPRNAPVVLPLTPTPGRRDAAPVELELTGHPQLLQLSKLLPSQKTCHGCLCGHKEQEISD